MISTLYATMFYIATILLVVGVAMKMRIYWRIPAPLKIVLTPAPTTRRGVVWRMVREVVLFESLFKANKWIWVFGWMFHFGLLLVAFRHLRYFTEPVWLWVSLMQSPGTYAGFALMAGLAGLLVRRFVVDRIRYISAPSDYLMLILLLGIGGSGLLMRYVSRTDIVAVKMFFLGLMQFDLQPLPGDPILLLHLGLVVLLMLIFPISKLMHAPGLFFSPSRTMVDNPREQRYQPPIAGNRSD